jgi:hypothetical protein
VIGYCQVAVYEGKKYKSRRMGFIVPVRTKRFGRYDTWVAYDYLWNRLGCRSSRGEATSLVLLRTGVWR